jgi:ATP-dependent protease Clp ATPase subunit
VLAVAVYNHYKRSLRPLTRSGASSA